MPVAPAAAIITAGLRPDLFHDSGSRIISRHLLIALLAILMLAGCAFRLDGLSVESLSEDELNKLSAAADYRARGLTTANGEHPFLMKALLTASLFAAEEWNKSALVVAHPESLRINVEAALRFPVALFGAGTALLIYLIAAELFGTEVGLIAAALWAFDPLAIGLNRIAKEDTFLLFFFLLANVFWLRGQRVAESEPSRNPEPYYWATGAAYGAMLASKYAPFLLPVSLCYNYIFQRMKGTRWVIGKPRYLKMIAVMCVVFVICNPTILLPGVWHEMKVFAGERIGHDSYEFMGQLYPHRMTDWFKGVPWHFYFFLIAVKLPLPALLGFIVGMPLLFRRRLGDGRFFLLFWMFYWALAFVFGGGKFIRYFTVALPAVLIASAIGIRFVASLITRLFAKLSAKFSASDDAGFYARSALASLCILCSAWASASAAPHYRLYTNLLGGGKAGAGRYFPHDEFYDSSMGQVMFEIARRASPGARVASESPAVADYYAHQANRADLTSVSLSDSSALRDLKAGDLIVVERGRRYFSNDALLKALHQSATPALQVTLDDVPSVEVYILDQSSLSIVAAHAQR
ncbi:MAG TPA: glycosyltransferase family 39 protein [Pyrinomonadaceae bacterium]|nr:glycosyltransferase family 39 protein [Pyrinomonadaceae bacterium]